MSAPDVLPSGTKEEKASEWTQFLIGISCLLPWNALITAIPYFLSRLEGSPYSGTFGSYLTISFTLTQLLAFTHATFTSQDLDISGRIRKSLVLLSFLFITLALSPLFPFPPSSFFCLVMGVAVSLSLAVAYLQNGAVALASLFGPSAIQSIMSGQGAVGVLVSVVQFATNAFAQGKGRQDDGGRGFRISAYLFFTISTLVLISTLVAHAWLMQTSAHQRVMEAFESTKKERQTRSHEDNTNEESPLLNPDSNLTRPQESLLDIAKSNWQYNVGVALVFTVTLSVYPPITSSIRSVNPSSDWAILSPVLFNYLHFIIFNVSDWIGRYLCSYPGILIWDPNRLLILSISRISFIPVFLMCNIQRSPLIHTTPFINSDIAYFLILIVFGLSNGYVMSLCMMAAPSLEHNRKLKKESVEIAATVAQFCLIGGLTLGSVSSFAVRAAVCNCNPFKS